MEAQEEHRCIERAQQGEADAFGPIITAYQQKVFNFIMGMTRDPAIADELTQEVFLKAWKALPRFRGESGFQTWLFQIALNATRSWGRWKKIGLARFVSLSEPVEMERDDKIGYQAPQLADTHPGADPLRQSESEALQEQLSRAIDRLPPREKEVFHLRHYEDLSLKEIAQMMGIAEGSVKAHLFHALEKMRKFMGEPSNVL
jgi:RNA polymerase sigma-70 factor (ECF subfamily)